MKKSKWYVVWKGVEPGVYDNWAECKRQIDNFEGALYKSFPSIREAKEAYDAGPWSYIGKKKTNNPAPEFHSIIRKSISVDAACSGNPGNMEYRGVYTDTGEEIFRIGPLKCGTNNVGEFLAIVHGLALQKKMDLHLPIYSDSVNAMIWIKKKKCNTKLERNTQNEVIFNLIERAEFWLKNNTYDIPILKWETKEWGEIPADFGRKQ